MSMSNDELKVSFDFWDAKHSSYERDKIITDGWLDGFQNIIKGCSTPILDLGCGGGNDTLYFINCGKEVIPCDQSPNAIMNIRRNFPEVKDARVFNFLDGFDFPDKSFEIICADLCLHYFRMEDTAFILQELKRLLVPGGHLFARVNSVKDTLHGAGQGEEIEHHVYKLEDGAVKRFFDEEDVKTVFADFEIEFCEEQRMGRYGTEKIVYSLCLKR